MGFWTPWRKPEDRRMTATTWAQGGEPRRIPGPVAGQAIPIQTRSWTEASTVHQERAGQTARSGPWASPSTLNDDPLQAYMLQVPTRVATAVVSNFWTTAPNGTQAIPQYRQFAILDPRQIIAPFIPEPNSPGGAVKFDRPSRVRDQLLDRLLQYQNDLLGTP